MAVAGTGQDAFFFVFFALLVGALLTAEWRWRWRTGPRVRRFLEALPKFNTILVMICGGGCYGEQRQARQATSRQSLTLFPSAITYYVNMLQGKRSSFHPLLQPLTFRSPAEVDTRSHHTTPVSSAFNQWVNLNPPQLLFFGFLPILLFDAAMRAQVSRPSRLQGPLLLFSC